MDSFLILGLLFFFGASVASFLQMYLDTDGKNLFIKNSKCDSCGEKLGWVNLIPVVSWVLQFGKTKCCEKMLSYKYLFGELILGLWFVGSYLWFEINLGSLIYLFTLNFINNFYFVLSLLLGGIFFILVIQDLNEMEVESRWLWALVSLGILGAIVNLENLWSILVFSPFWSIYFFGKYLNKPMIGEADPYVFTALGFFFGIQFSISLFFYSVWLGALLGIGYLYFINKKFERNIQMPFLPIIFIASITVLLFNYHLIRIQDILLANEIFLQI